MKLLILGGTGFLGPHTVEAALAAGHSVTLFNRGKTNADRFPDVETLIGNRDPLKENGLTSLRGRSWDVVIDICGYVPRIVEASAQLLANHVAKYVFISSISVYSDLSQLETDENSPVGSLADPTVENVTGEAYGPLKALCEQAAEAAMPGRVLNIRPGLIVGPGDPTDRFTYWPVRIDHGGQVLAPGDPNDRVQIVDARDLANFIVSATQQSTGTMNAAGPKDRFTMREMLEGCQSVTQSDASLTWITSEFLLKNEVAPWSGIPLWLSDSPDMRGFARISNARAVSAGLQFRPFEETARDTLTWFKQTRPNQPLRAGLTADRERELLATWNRRTGG